MYVRTLNIKDFRNIKNAHLTFQNGINILYGENAQGKTNTVEAIKLTLNGNSAREHKRENFLHPDTDTAKIKVEVEKNNETNVAELTLTKEKKQIILDDEPVRKRQALLRSFCVILFTPDDIFLVKGSPVKRRDYLNESLSLFEVKYYSLYVEYQKILKQRNALLRNYQKNCESLLEVYDENLALVGSRILLYRIRFLKLLNEACQIRYGTISEAKEKFTLSYISNVLTGFDLTDIQSDYLQEIKDSRPEDIRKKTTTVGIHHDDIGLFLDGKNARNFASQGQMRSIALSLKLSVVDLYSKRFKEKPIVILDDVLSELDEKRKTLLLSSLIEHQTFITSANLPDFHNAKNARVFFVKDGAIKEYTDNAEQH